MARGLMQKYWERKMPAVPSYIGPTGRSSTMFTNPPGRQMGPLQNLIPVGPPTTHMGRVVEGPTTFATSTTGTPVMVTAIPKLDSSLIGPSGNPSYPWTSLLNNLYRLAQPTGVPSGTFAGITFNVNGQAIAATNSGATFDKATITNATLDNPTLTGKAVAPTPVFDDNSTLIATTAYIQAAGFLKAISLSGDVIGSGAGSAPTKVVGLEGRPLPDVAPAAGQFLMWNGSAWVPGNAIPDAPADGHIYGRQNGAWVLVPGSP